MRDERSPPGCPESAALLDEAEHLGVGEDEHGRLGFEPQPWGKEPWSTCTVAASGGAAIVGSSVPTGTPSSRRMSVRRPDCWRR